MTASDPTGTPAQTPDPAWDEMPESCECPTMRRPPCSWCERGDEPAARLPLSAWRTLLTIGADR